MSSQWQFQDCWQCHTEPHNTVIMACKARTVGLLSNDLTDKWVQLIVIFKSDKLADDITSPHANYCWNSRHLQKTWIQKELSLYRIKYDTYKEVWLMTVYLTPYSIARSVWSSMSTFAMATRPFCFAIAFSNLGPRILQGPHHLVQMGATDTISVTSRSNCKSFHKNKYSK